MAGDNEADRSPPAGEGPARPGAATVRREASPAQDEAAKTAAASRPAPRTAAEREALRAALDEAWLRVVVAGRALATEAGCEGPWRTALEIEREYALAVATVLELQWDHDGRAWISTPRAETVWNTPARR